MSKSDFIAIAMQAGGALKTPAATAVAFPPVSTEGLSASREELEIDETLGSRAPSASQYGGRVYEGDVEGAIRPNTIPYIFNMFFGSPTTTSEITARPSTTAVTLGQILSSGTFLFEVTTAGTTAASPPAGLASSTPGGAPVTDGTAALTNIGLAATYPAINKHLWAPVAVGKRPMPASVWTVNADPTPSIVDKYVGTKGNELTMEVEANGYFMFTAGLAAAILDDTQTAPTASRDASAKMAFHRITAQISVAGAALSSIALQNFSLSFNNNLVTDLFVLGSKEVDDIPDGNIESEVTFTPTQNISQHYRRALKDIPEDVRLVLRAQGDLITGFGTRSYEVVVDLKRLQYTEAPVEIDASETLRGVEITARPVLDETTGAMLEVYVINTNAGTTYVG